MEKRLDKWPGFMDNEYNSYRTHPIGDAQTSNEWEKMICPFSTESWCVVRIQQEYVSLTSPGSFVIEYFSREFRLRRESALMIVLS
jgi:hypothetical protein